MTKQRNSISSFRETGYVCEVCGVHTKAYNGEPTERCLSCGEVHRLKKEWDQKVTVITKVEAVGE